MGLHVTVPYPADGPRSDVCGLLSPGVGSIIDGGRTWSDTGDGELLVTSRGLIACDLDPKIFEFQIMLKRLLAKHPPREVNQ